MFKDIETAEEFEEIQNRQITNDIEFVEQMEDFVRGGDHRALNFTLINVGNLLKICSLFLELEQEKIESFLKLEKLQTRNAKMTFILKELNEKINLRYEFKDDVEIIKMLYVYDGKGYIFIDKMEFLGLLMEKDLMDPVDDGDDNLSDI